MLPRFSLILALIGGLAPLPAFAWGTDGHRIVCAITWDEMTPAARDRVKTLLSIETRAEFAETCNWADEYRLRHPETGSWYFVNGPLGATSVNTQRDCADPGSCVVVMIDTWIATLRGTTPGIDRTAALKFLAHFVADVHQPLHVSFKEDRGGKEIKGTFFGQPTNMHAIWDSRIVEYDGRSWQQIATDLEAGMTSKERTQWTRSTPIDWANESLAITLAPATGYVTHGDTFRLGEAYERRNLPVVLDRLKRAGVRLGYLLNSVLG